MTLRKALIATTFVAGLAVSAPASAQSTAADPAMTEPADDDDDFPWGLLGLLGLAGLLGRKRNDHDVNRTTNTNR